ncbi:biotin/lipoyl-containing protein [Azospirillum isscasi]|uniref:Biotin/lipoyl-containing protein n=1 Tax=Azospirillum isscasi TaxID=3053926 RepID=A0ABU0WP17_9PROT|nr:biotin/lipoyl-containing protein [Azospirillum isscasi]MDQ2105973.1 biotin/lipoyl-containing protein [Azospirillum isscasi]
MTDAALSGFHIVAAPRTSASDDRLQVVALAVADGTAVAAGQLLMEIEGAKAVVEVFAEAAGIAYFPVAPGDAVEVGRPVAVIVPPEVSRDQALAAVPAPSKAQAAAAGTDEEVRFTRGATELLNRHGLAADLFAGRGLVTTTMVEREVARREADRNWRPTTPRRGGNGRVVLVGAGRGAHQILSILLFEEGTQPVAILDDAADKHGEYIKGVPVLGPVSRLESMVAAGEVDAAICAVSSSIPFRRKIRDLARQLNLPLANAIHPTAWFDDGVVIGQGNYIGPFCYFGADARVGDNCFLSSRTTFEHHNEVGDEVTTGPNVATAGSVRVGSQVKFGTGIVVENRLSIGSGSIIASHVAITCDVPEGSVVKRQVGR